jgi:hypothetical protein
MPGIRLFGRRFNFSSDDLTIPSLIDITFRLPLLIIFLLFRLKDNSSYSRCSSSFNIGYFYPLLSVYALIALVSFLIFIISLRGTPVNNIGPRRHMPFLIYIRLFLVLIDIGINLMGLIIIIRSFQICEVLFSEMLIISIVISCTTASSLFVILAFFIDLTGVVSSEKKWEMRIKFIFCCGRDYGKKRKKNFIKLI